MSPGESVDRVFSIRTPLEVNLIEKDAIFSFSATFLEEKNLPGKDRLLSFYVHKIYRLLMRGTLTVIELPLGLC